MEPDPNALTAQTHPVVHRFSPTFALRVSERKLLLGAGDLLCANIALTAAVAWRFGTAAPLTTIVRPSWYLVLTGLWLVVAFLVGAYDFRRTGRLWTGISIGVVTSLIVAVAYLLIPYVTPPLPPSRLALFAFVGAMVGSVAAWRAFYGLVLIQPALSRKALIVGAGWAGRTMVEAIRSVPGEYDLVGFIDDDPRKHIDVIDGLPVLGTRDELCELAAQTGATEIIVAITQPDQMHPEMFQAILDCHEKGMLISQMPLLFEQLTGRVPVEHAGRNLHIVLPLNGSPSRLQRAAKRFVDLLIGVVGVALTAVLLPVVWLAMRLEGGGPVFFRQTRVGQGGRPFALLKFRTMIPSAEAYGPQWAEENDSRATRVGRVLRRVHIDEIPQAVNILRSELSFVGPRPERPEFIEQLERRVPFFRARHAVRPGITGWAQVNYPYADSVEDALIKLQYDLYYIKHQSFWFDLVICLRTIRLVLTLHGR